MPFPDSTQMLLAYVGCRTTRERNARGDGINVFRIDSPSTAWAHVQLVPILPNPSFLAFDRTERLLFAVHGDASEVSSFRIDPRAGELEQVGTWSTRGRNPVSLITDPADRFLIVANHASSSIAVLPFDVKTGALGAVLDLVQVDGPIGPHRTEQPFAKPHQVAFDPSGRFVIVPDKGTDRVLVFGFDAVNGKLTPGPVGFAATREGAGPRHMAFHPTRPFAYVLNELDSTMLACRYDSSTGQLEPMQILSAIPDTWVANSRCSEVVVSADGRFVFGSNRGSDTVATFAVDEATGRLAQVGWAPSQGMTPRHFALDPWCSTLYTANEDSDTIAALEVDRNSGHLSPLGIVARTPSPTCVLLKRFLPY